MKACCAHDDKTGNDNTELLHSDESSALNRSKDNLNGLPDKSLEARHGTRQNDLDVVQVRSDGIGGDVLGLDELFGMS